jgi:hypothetical protein
MEKFTFKKLLDDMNFSVFLLAALGSLLALWLNSNYISLEVYERDRDILVLKMDSLEKEITNLKYITDKNSQEVEKLVDLIEKVELLMSKLITSDGNIITSDKMQELDRELLLIRKDVEYIKRELKL